MPEICGITALSLVSISSQRRRASLSAKSSVWLHFISWACPRPNRTLNTQHAAKERHLRDGFLSVNFRRIKKTDIRGSTKGELKIHSEALNPDSLTASAHRRESLRTNIVNSSGVDGRGVKSIALNFSITSVVFSALLISIDSF